MRACSYERVSTEEQSRGLSLDGQRATNLAEIERRGWEAVDDASDASSGKNLKRAGLQRLLGRLKAGELDALVVAKMDRLSRSTLDFYDLLGRAEREGWTLVCLQPNVDMSDPMGRAMAGMAAIFAQFEREMISLRQLESVAARRAAGTYPGSKFQAQVVARIHEMVQDDVSMAEMAKTLDREGYPTPKGAAKWSPRTIQRWLQAEGLVPPPQRLNRKRVAYIKPPLVVGDDDADDRDEHEQDGPEDVAQVGEIRGPAEADQGEQDEQDPEVPSVDVGEQLGEHDPRPTLASRRAFSAYRQIGR